MKRRTRITLAAAVLARAGGFRAVLQELAENDGREM